MAATTGIEMELQKRMPPCTVAGSRLDDASRDVTTISSSIGVPTPPTLASTPSSLPSSMPQACPISRQIASRAVP
jgi:hypothetical protein